MSVSSEIQELNANLVAAKDAVETKGGTTGDTRLSGLVNEIKSIPSVVKGDAIRFIDYDGTIVTQISLEDAHDLSSLPEVPVHEGLSGVGWTHSLDVIKSATRPLDVGAMYENAVNPAQSIFYILPRVNETVTLNFSQSAENGVIIDWGDGSATETVAGEGKVTTTHAYTTVDVKDTPFKLTLTPEPNVDIGFGHGTTEKNLFNNGYYTYSTVVKAVFGRGNITDYALNECAAITSVVISDLVSWIPMSAFAQCRALGCAIIPNSVGGIGGSAFANCSSLSTVVIPDSVSFLATGVFNYDYGLSFIIIPDSIEQISSFAFLNASLRSVIIPASTTYMSRQAFGGASLTEIKFKDRAIMPDASEAFFTANGPCPSTIDCSEFSQVPTVDSNFFTNMPAYTRILVPASLEADWEAATNWSTYANQIVGV